MPAYPRESISLSICRPKSRLHFAETLAALAPGTAWRRADTTWFKNCRWGMFTHDLADAASNLQAIALTPDDWNRRL
jgi:hypothetical protein